MPRRCTMSAVPASRAIRGFWSSAIIDSSPWMVDSAPELRLISPDARDPVEGPAGRGVVHRPRRPGWRRRTTPPTMPASVARCGPPVAAGGGEQAPAAASRRRRRSARRRPGSGSRPLSGPPEVSSQGSNVNESRDRAVARGAGSPSDAEARARAAGICAPQACQTERDSAQGRIAPERPAAGVAAAQLRDALAEPGQRGAGAPPSRPARRRTPTARGPPRPMASAPSAISQAGARLAVDVEVLAVPVEHLPVDRVDRRARGGRAGTSRTRGRSFSEGRVALAERPDRAGQPVGRVAVGGVGQLDRLGAAGSACRRAASTAPRCRRSGPSRLQVGERRAASRRPRRRLVRRAGGLPVPQVDDRGAADVVGVEGALAPGVGLGVVRRRRRRGGSCRRRSGSA